MPATIILCILLALAIGVAIRSLVRRRREGKFLCGGSCGHCQGCRRCERYKADEGEGGAEAADTATKDEHTEA